MKKFIGYQRGINLGGWLSQCNHGKEHYDNFINEEDIKRIASYHTDHVRVPVDYELVETIEGTYKEEGFIYIDSCLKWCEKYGLNMILDLHKTAGYSFNDQENADEFFNNSELQDRFIALWKEFSIRYGCYKDRLAFEILNEIVSYEVADKWNKIAKKTIKAIREIASDIKILIGGVCYNSVFTVKLLEDFKDKNIIYNFHCYEPFAFTHQRAGWVSVLPKNLHISYPGNLSDYSELMSITLRELMEEKKMKEFNSEFFEKIFEDAIKIAEERDVSLYCGEYGVINQADSISTLNWYQDIHETFEKHGIGRALWTYKSMDFGIVEEHYLPVFDEIVKNI